MNSAIGTSPNHEMLQCPREADVLDALASARWPDRVNPELSQHVASCAVCRDVVAVAAAMREDHDATWQEANVPSSGQMWWRAEMRARQEAIRDASRPVTIAQGVAALLALVFVVAAGWFAWPTLQGLFATPPPFLLPLAIGLLAVLVVTPVALYFVLSD